MLNQILLKILIFTFLIFKNNIILFKILRKLKLKSVKNFKIYTTNYNLIVKNVYNKLVLTLIKFIYFLFYKIFKFSKSLSLILGKIKFIKFIIYKFYKTLFNFRLIVNLIKNQNKLKNLYNKDIKKKIKKFRKKKVYKEKFFHYVRTKRKLPVKLYMFTGKLKKRYKLNKEKKDKRNDLSQKLQYNLDNSKVSSYVELLIKNNILPFLSTSYFFLSRVIKILNIFKKEKNIFILQNLLERTKGKVEGFSSYLNYNLDTFKLIKKFDKLIYVLFLSKVLKSKIKRKGHKIKYHKNFIKYFFLSSFLILYSLLKSLLLINSFFNIKSMQYIMDKLDFFYSSRNLFNYYMTRYIY